MCEKCNIESNKRIDIINNENGSYAVYQGLTATQLKEFKMVEKVR